MKNTTPYVSSQQLPQTINIHLTRACNFSCRFCYAGFSECEQTKIHPDQLMRILKAIGSADPLPSGRSRKVNFAGGEPLLFTGLPSIIKSCKQLGLVTSLVTNGSLLNEHVIDQLTRSLDICAISVDSGESETNRLIGRCGKSFRPNTEFYQTLAKRIHESGMRLKINTVVNRFNLTENLGELVASILPFRWKLFQVKQIIGQNDIYFSEMEISVKEFDDFVTRNRILVPPGIAVVPETASDMTTSYAMIGPNGCFFDNTDGLYRYSRPILEAGLVEAFQDVSFDSVKFLNRGGSYE